MCSRLQQKLMTLKDLKRKFTACSLISVMRALTKRLRLESRGFRYKVALYFIYLRLKFDDSIFSRTPCLISITTCFCCLISRVSFPYTNDMQGTSWHGLGTFLLNFRPSLFTV